MYMNNYKKNKIAIENRRFIQLHENNSKNKWDTQ